MAIQNPSLERAANLAVICAVGLDSEDQIALGETTTFRTTATPTLLLLDSTKVVRRIWTGLLAEGQQEAVARIVLGPSQPQ